jgi:hypothetical protein
MATWSSDELNRIGAAEEVRIATRRTDGTLRKPVIVWIVRAGDKLYVRSVKGRNAAWFRGVQARHEGSLQADGVDKDVDSVEVADNNQDRVDAAYRSKYARYPSIVPSVLTPETRADKQRGGHFAPAAECETVREGTESVVRNECAEHARCRARGPRQPARHCEVEGRRGNQEGSGRQREWITTSASKADDDPPANQTLPASLANRAASPEPAPHGSP